MALAVLRYEESDGEVARFHADIGHNPYYRYRIGDADARDDGGVLVLANPGYESTLEGPLRPAALGRTSIEIPLSAFGRHMRSVQLTSYREPPDVGPAISDVVEVPLSALPPGLLHEERVVLDEQAGVGVDGTLSAPAFAARESGRTLWTQGQSQHGGMRAMHRQLTRSGRVPITIRPEDTGRYGAHFSSNSYGAPAQRPTPGDGRGAAYRRPYAVPFTYREVHYSNAMFLGALGSLLAGALPTITKVVGGLGGASGIAKLVGNLFGGATPTAAGTKAGGARASAGGGAAPNPSGANPQSMTPELATQIVELIKALSPATAAAAAPAAAVQAGQSLAMSQYSQQMIAPALLAALPALAPLLQQALNPQTIQAVMGNIGPKATIGAVTDAVKDIGGLNIQAYQNILDHIQKNMPSSDTSGLLNHLLAVSESLSQPSILPSYRRIDSVRLEYAPQTAVMLRGREQLVYRQDAPSGLAFPLALETPRPIRNATLYLLVKEIETLALVAEKQWDVSNSGSGLLSTVPALSSAESAALLPGRDYLVCTYLVWKTKRGERIGASRTQTVHVTGAYAYQGLDTGDEIVPLNDVERYRSFWHKVWQASFARETRRWQWDCKYYYTVHDEGGETDRLETLTEEAPQSGRRIEGRMKSGLRLSLAALNALLPQISSHPALDAARLAALGTPAALAAFGRAARSKAEFHGAEGDSVALWVYPEMRLQPVVLLRSSAANDDGVVQELVEETVYFPVPAMCHFVGVTTETDPYPALHETEVEL